MSRRGDGSLSLSSCQQAIINQAGAGINQILGERVARDMRGQTLKMLRRYRPAAAAPASCDGSPGS